MVFSDTSANAHRQQVELLRAAGAARRAALALDMSSSAIKASRRAIESRNPELDEESVRLLWAELHYGKEIADAVRIYLRQLP